MEFTRKRINDTQEIDINLKIENNLATANDFITKGDINFKKNNLNQAILDYTQAIEIQPSGIAYFKRAQIYHSKNNLQLALSDYDNAILYDNSIQDIFYYRGSIYLGLQKYEKAIHDFSTAINLQPNDYNNLFYRALTYEKIGRKNEAVNDYSKAIGISAQNYEAYFNRGKLYLEQNQEQKARQDFKIAVSLSPEISKQTGMLLQQFEKQKEVIYLEKQKEVEYKRLMELAKVQKSQGQVSNPIETYTKAISLNNRSAEAYFLRGELLWKKGEKMQGYTDFNKASEIDDKYTSMKIAIVGVDSLKQAGKLIGNLFSKKK